MARAFLTVTIVGFLLVTGYGCGIKARGYVADRERVDQANTGNSGYVAGQGSSMAGRKTRKVYVLEFEREKKEKKKPEAKPVAPEVAAAAVDPAVEGMARTTMIETPEPETPAVDAAEHEVTTNAAGQKVIKYTVEKDDTLQKISKKFYNSFSKWTRIYDANKEAIKNPNFVKPGTVLEIPAE
jgi:nucleoid-associated protein YgaU